MIAAGEQRVFRSWHRGLLPAACVLAGGIGAIGAVWILLGLDLSLRMAGYPLVPGFACALPGVHGYLRYPTAITVGPRSLTVHYLGGRRLVVPNLLDVRFRLRREGAVVEGEIIGHWPPRRSRDAP